MKNTLMIIGLALTMNVFASETFDKTPPPSRTEIEQNRACFKDLEVQGCGSLESDPEHFRACMSNSLTSLDEHCKKMMLKLYGDG